MTQAGMILGTAAYMSPEQAKGRDADKRSDIWAFGCVLYEMLTGSRAFPGADLAETLAAVIRSEPDWAALPPDTPASIHRLLRRCLNKDRKARLADTSSLRIEIDDARRPEQGPTASRTFRRERLAWAAGVLLAGTRVRVRTRRRRSPGSSRAGDPIRYRHAPRPRHSLARDLARRTTDRVRGPSGWPAECLDPYTGWSCRRGRSREPTTPRIACSGPQTAGLLVSSQGASSSASTFRAVPCRRWRTPRWEPAAPGAGMASSSSRPLEGRSTACRRAEAR